MTTDELLALLGDIWDEMEDLMVFEPFRDRVKKALQIVEFGTEPEAHNQGDRA